jgi:hypothetical protein
MDWIGLESCWKCWSEIEPRRNLYTALRAIQGLVIESFKSTGW